MSDTSCEWLNNRISAFGRTIVLRHRILDAARVGDRLVVVFDYMEFPRGLRAPNLVCFDAEGKQLWIADGPIGGPTDAYTSILSASPLVACNFAGFTCEIDPVTGEILKADFTK